jgi:hypothetical protein
MTDFLGGRISLLMASTPVMKRLLNTLETLRYDCSGWTCRIHSHSVFQIIRALAAEAHESVM